VDPPPCDHDASAPHAGGARGARHHRRLAAALLRLGTPRRPGGGSAHGAEGGVMADEGPFKSTRYSRARPEFVMAGLVPAIHVFLEARKTWMPGTRPGMTSEWLPPLKLPGATNSVGSLSLCVRGGVRGSGLCLCLYARRSYF